MLEHVDALIAFTGIILMVSLVVTVITQIVVAGANLRGKNLLWGLTTLLAEIEPDLKDEAEKVARKILSNPLINRHKKRLPPVIRMEEFSQLLIQLSESGDVEEFNQKTRNSLKKLTRIDPNELAKQLEKLPDQLEKKAKENIKNAQQLIYEHLKQARVKVAELESWFDNMTDRISERFTLHSKIITAVAALLVALALQLDSLQLIHQVYADSEMRSKLLASTNLFLERGTEILGQRSIFDTAMDSLQNSFPSLPQPTQSFSNRASAERWLQTHTPPELNLSLVLERYRQIQKKVTEDRLGYLGDQLVVLENDLKGMGLKFFSGNYTWRFWEWGWKKIIGMLISVALLSLGAPFWFNMLKNLTNLRTRLMQNEEKERLKRKLAAEQQR